MGEIHFRLNIERYMVGELDTDNARVLEEHCRTCPDCSGYLHELRNEQKQFLNVHPFEEFTAAAGRKKGRVLSSALDNLRGVFTRPALVPAWGFLLALVVITPLLLTRMIDSGTSDFRYKGNSTSLAYYFMRGDSVQTGTAADILKENDRVQIVYSSKADQHVSLMSIDSKGTVSFYDPDPGSSICSIPTKKGNRQNYPGSIVLDNSSGEELVVVILSRGQLDRDLVRSWISGKYLLNGNRVEGLGDKLMRKPPRKDCHVETVLLRKS